MCKQLQFFQFYDQNQPVSSMTTKEKMNFATLNKSTFVGRQWTLCSSMFVGFVRGRQAFFAVSRDDTSEPWLTVYLTLEDGSFRVQLKVMGNSYVLGSQKGKLKIHAWSNICTTIDGISGHLGAVVDGYSLENISINDLKTTEVINLINRLVLGVTWIDRDRVYQSESQVGNVHAYDTILPLSKLEEATESGDFPESAALAWNPGSDWTKTGEVSIRSSDIQSAKNKEFLVFSEVDSWESCAKLCPRVAKGGQMPPVGKPEIGRKLKELGTPNVYIPAPYSDFDKEGTFVNIYNRTQLLDTSLFDDGEPNDGRHGNCVMWTLKMDGTLTDEVCRPMAGIKVQCFCLVDQNVLLELRGLCHGSYLDSIYTVKFENKTIKLKGITGTEISLDNGEWKAATTKDQKKTGTKSILASPGSYLLGKHDWIISRDSRVCSKDSLTSASASFYRTSLKLSSCDDDEFTCWDGECVPMEERCDQVFDCSDQSDERDCQMLVLEDSYQSSVPPLLPSLAEDGKRVVPPVKVNVTLELIEVLGVNEKENQIEAKIETTLKWYDHRVNFYNLKKESFLNALRITDVKRVWSPKVIFSNTKESANIQDSLDKAIMHVDRKGNSTPSGPHVMDETDIFKIRCI